MSDSWSEETLAELADLELLQGFDDRGVELSERRRELYEGFKSTADEPWATTAKAAYAAMARHGDYVASVGDQLSADIDILENADVYASLGGFSVSEITTGLGSRWSPPAIWFRFGRELAGSDSDVEVRQLLLRAGAEGLADFYARVAGGAVALTRSSRWRLGQSVRRREIAFISGVLLFRRDRFLEGPRENGRYLTDERVSLEEILQAVRADRAVERIRGRVGA